MLMLVLLVAVEGRPSCRTANARTAADEQNPGNSRGLFPRGVLQEQEQVTSEKKRRIGSGLDDSIKYIKYTANWDKRRLAAAALGWSLNTRVSLSHRSRSVAWVHRAMVALKRYVATNRSRSHIYLIFFGIHSESLW